MNSSFPSLPSVHFRGHPGTQPRHDICLRPRAGRFGISVAAPPHRTALSRVEHSRIQLRSIGPVLPMAIFEDLCRGSIRRMRGRMSIRNGTEITSRFRDAMLGD